MHAVLHMVPQTLALHTYIDSFSLDFLALSFFSLTKKTLRAEIMWIVAPVGRHIFMLHTEDHYIGHS